MVYQAMYMHRQVSVGSCRLGFGAINFQTCSTVAQDVDNHVHRTCRTGLNSQNVRQAHCHWCGSSLTGTGTWLGFRGDGSIVTGVVRH